MEIETLGMAKVTKKASEEAIVFTTIYDATGNGVSIDNVPNGGPICAPSVSNHPFVITPVIPLYITIILQMHFVLCLFT